MRKQHFRSLVVWCGLFFCAGPVVAQPNTPPTTPPPVTNYLGFFTNGPAILEGYSVTTTRMITNRSLPPRLATNPAVARVFPSVYTYTNSAFRGFKPESLNNAIWTNFLARTNGRTLHVWSERTRPEGWPTNRPVVRWNTNSLVWGMKGLTALSPSWQGEGYPGQVPFTALTRRHAYTRGHGMGAEGFDTQRAGQKVWFLTRDNVMVEAVIKRLVVRASAGTNKTHRDYTIALFDRDLPDTIEPMRVVAMPDVQSRYPYPRQVLWPYPIFQTEQGGNVSTGIAPLTVNTWKPGDSGSPNLIPLPGELIFFSGRSTSGPSAEMQEDMDELSRLEGLKPGKYQLRYVDLTEYPEY